MRDGVQSNAGMQAFESDEYYGYIHSYF